MTWGAVGAAAVGTVGGALMGGGGGSPGHANDWINPYTSATGSAVANMMSGVANAQAPQWYGGNTVAGMNPYLSGAIGAQAGYGAGRGGQIANQSFNAGAGAIGGIGQGMDMMSQLRGQPGGPFQFNQGVYDQTMSNLMPAMQGSYDAATRDNNRALNWSTLPGLNMDAAGAGHFGSTKQGQGTALAQGMTADRNADIGASMYQNAVNQAQQAGMNAGQQNLNANMGMIDAYGNYGQVGGGLLNQSYNQGLASLNAGVSAGQLQQGYDQSMVDADVNKWNYNQNLPFTDAAMRMSLFNQEKVPMRGQVQSGGGAAGMMAGGIQGLQAGLGLYGMGQDAGWWGSPSPTNYVAPQNWASSNSFDFENKSSPGYINF